MSITIDDVPLDSGKLGLTTVGEVISHVTRGNKLVVQLLIDGSEPDYSGMDTLRARPIADSAIYIETACPVAVCRSVLDSLDETLVEADGLRVQAAEFFRKGDAAAGLPKLGLCFTLWHNAQDALGKVGRLLKADLETLSLEDGQSVREVLVAFAAQLTQLKDAIESRDYVLCCDVLTYDMDTASNDWKSAVAALRRIATK
jgi:hypothetical protein